MTTLVLYRDAINSRKKLALVVFNALRLCGAFVLALAAGQLWLVASDGNESAALTVVSAVFFLSLAVERWRFRPELVSLDELRRALEVNEPQLAPAPASIDQDHDLELAGWGDVLAEERRRDFADIKRRVLTQLRLWIPALLVVFWPFWPVTARPLFADIARRAALVLAPLNESAEINVQEGSMDAKGDGHYTLSVRKTVEVDLAESNMVEVTLKGRGESEDAPVVTLVRDSHKAGAERQSFQMHPAGETSIKTYVATFHVEESAGLELAAYAGPVKLAHFNVKKLPVPAVSLELNAPPMEYWPDEKPLPLTVTAHAEAGLQTILLVIAADKRESREVVNQVLALDKHDVEARTTVTLESYLENDIAEVTIVAEAIDRSVPRPLVGHSQPIVIKTASAYGRYKQSLESMGEVKKALDEAVANQTTLKSPDDTIKMMERALSQAETAPFFDALDRFTMERIHSGIRQQKTTANAEDLLSISAELNDFLFEHEALDDRERDRDFFVGMRSFARILEQDAAERPVAAKVVAERLKTFLDGRSKRWEMRVARLGEGMKPADARHVLHEKPFHHGVMKSLEEDQSAGAKSKSTSTVAETVTGYRRWIEELEAKEDEARAAAEKKREEGAANARNELRELQKAQAEIAFKLKNADARPSEELEKSWPSARIEQNTNLHATRSFEAKLRAFAPEAGVRVKAAAQAMEGTLKEGEGGKYVEAESAADLAGRLLRLAEKAASEPKDSRRDRGRRRRISGDNYFGQSIVGGDVEIRREYQVDKRYREDVLDQVETEDIDPADRDAVEAYLRSVVR